MGRRIERDSYGSMKMSSVVAISASGIGGLRVTVTADKVSGQLRGLVAINST